MSIRTWISRIVSAVTLGVLVAAPSATAKNKDSGSFAVGCLTQDTALQAAEGLVTGTAAANVTISPASLWPPHHKLRAEDISMSLAADSTSPVDVTLTVNDITDDQVAGDDAGGNGCGKPTAKQGADWSPTDFSTLVASGTLQHVADTPVAISGAEVRAERCAKLGTRTYEITVTCCDVTHGVCDTVGTVNGVDLASLPTLDVVTPKNKAGK